MSPTNESGSNSLLAPPPDPLPAGGEGKDAAGSAPTSWAVFFFFVCLYMLSIGRGFYSSDGDVMFKTAAALVEQHTFVLEPDPGLPQIIQGQRHQFYSKYDPGLPLLLAPFYVTGGWIGEINSAHRYRLAATFVLYVPALAAAGALAALSRLTARLKWPVGEIPGPLMALSRHRRVVHAPAILAAGLASPLWYYARVLFAESVLACALTVSVLVVYLTPHRTRRGGVAPPGILMIAGAVFGIGVLTRATLVIYLPALVWLMARLTLIPDPSPAGRGRQKNDLSYKQDRMAWSQCFLRLAAFGIGILPFAAALLWHNDLRFGDPFRFGYAGEGFTTPIWEGVIGLLFSPGKSVFLYAPPLILSVMLWPRFRRMYPVLGECLALMWGAALIVYGTWWAWHGGWSWGPRFLVPLIPLSCLPLMVLPEGRIWRVSAAVLILTGIVVNGAGVLTDLTPHFAALTQDGETDYTTLHYNLRHIPQIAAWQCVIRGQTEPLAMFHLKATGLPATWWIGLPVLLLAGLATFGARFAYWCISNHYSRARRDFDGTASV